MFANTNDWRRITLWLVLFKIGYIAFVCIAVKLSSEFDKEKHNEVVAWWFKSIGGRQPPENRVGIAKHFATWDAQHYLFLSEVGYSKGVKSCAFYPLWPLSIRWFSI